MIQVSINFISPKQSTVSETAVEELVGRYGFSVLANMGSDGSGLTITRFFSDSELQMYEWLTWLGKRIRPLMEASLDLQVTFHSLPTSPRISQATALRSSARSASSWMKAWEELQNSSLDRADPV